MLLIRRQRCTLQRRREQRYGRDEDRGDLYQTDLTRLDWSSGMFVQRKRIRGYNNRCFLSRRQRDIFSVDEAWSYALAMEAAKFPQQLGFSKMRCLVVS